MICNASSLPAKTSIASSRMNRWRAGPGPERPRQQSGAPIPRGIRLRSPADQTAGPPYPESSAAVLRAQLCGGGHVFLTGAGCCAQIRCIENAGPKGQFVDLSPNCIRPRRTLPGNPATFRPTCDRQGPAARSGPASAPNNSAPGRDGGHGSSASISACSASGETYPPAARIIISARSA